MTTLFIDSDVILDIILQREPFFLPAAKILNLAGNENFKCCTSVHSLLNIHYLTRKAHGEKPARAVLGSLIQKLRIISEDIDLLKHAISSDFPDFEDAVQYYAAVSANANYIITRNIRDYKLSDIPVLTAEQFLRTLF